MPKVIVLAGALLLAVAAAAQEDSSVVRTGGGEVLSSDSVVLDWRLRHKPGRAALYSAIVPGAGQIYNRKYWKAPIVWGGLGLGVYFIVDNTREYERHRDAYVALIDGDPGTVSEFEGKDPESVRSVADTYHKWRDMSYIITAMVYVLNIVDASVDAHFVRFDVSNDLALELGPSPAMAVQGAAGLSLRVRL